MINYYNSKRFKNKVLITNDLGRFSFLEQNEFNTIKKDPSDLPDEKYMELKEKYFIYDGQEELFINEAGMELRDYKSYLFQGTTLHIFVLTKSCNQRCLYCQASVNDKDERMMTIETARKAVDFALKAPNKYLTFEFQGGEPLLNFNTLKFIVEYTKEVNVSKKIDFVLVSNLLLLNDEMMKFILKHDIQISTSLDGQGELHNKNRPAKIQNVHELLMQKISLIKENNRNVAAIQTTTKYSLDKYKEIVNQYVQIGLSSIIIRPLTKLGFASDQWDEIGYTAEEFLDFYKKTLEYIIELNISGINISEGHASIFLTKILGQRTPNYMELRSPCGGGIGQLAYYYNGEIYTCDEGRMLAEMGDKSFCLGNVKEAEYENIMNHPVCKTVMVSSCLENLKSCHDCVYSPYCGTCPVISYAIYKTVFPNLKEDFRCKVYKGILEILFEMILEDNQKIMDIFYSWIY